MEGGAKTPSREKDVEDTSVPKHPTEERGTWKKSNNTTGTKFNHPNKQTNKNRTGQTSCFKDSSPQFCMIMENLKISLMGNDHHVCPAAHYCLEIWPDTFGYVFHKNHVAILINVG